MSKITTRTLDTQPLDFSFKPSPPMSDQNENDINKSGQEDTEEEDSRDLTSTDSALNLTVSSSTIPLLTTTSQTPFQLKSASINMRDLNNGSLDANSLLSNAILQFSSPNNNLANMTSISNLMNGSPQSSSGSESNRNSTSSTTSRKRGKPLPEDLKDEAYWERRRKNNEAAKRSRDARRSKEMEVAFKAALLEQENLKLKVEVASLKQELAKLQYILLTNSAQSNNSNNRKTNGKSQ
jgi:hypothetical protein